MKKMGIAGWIAFVLVIIGALNWGLVGFFNFDLVAMIFGYTTVVSRVIYAIVGLAGIYMIVGAAMMKKE
jgi:uncharacterized protein